MPSGKPGPADLVIRPFRPEDAEACARIYVDARRDAFHWCDPGRFRRQDFFADSVDEAIYVAVSGGTVAGFMSLWTSGHFIHLLFVDPLRFREGIGTRLLDHAVVLLSPWAWLKCQQQNERALAFYRSRGWTLGSTGDNEIGPWVAVSWNAAAGTLPAG